MERLSAMIAPRWLDTRSQPTAVQDVAGSLAEAATRHVEGEIQLGGAEVLTYREMIRSLTVLNDRPSGFGAAARAALAGT